MSVPSWELFKAQDEAYRTQVFLPDVKARVAVEAGITMGWDQFVGDGGAVIGIDHYGASAPANILFQAFGFTVENVIETAKKVLSK